MVSIICMGCSVKIDQQMVLNGMEPFFVEIMDIFLAMQLVPYLVLSSICAKRPGAARVYSVHRLYTRF